MKRHIKFLGLSLLTLVLIAASTPCFAMMDIAHVSKARAKELGMVLRVKAAGHATTVELQFELKGELKNFSRVDLEVRDGETWVSTALKEVRANPERVAVSFTAAHGSLDKITLRVVTQSGAREMTGYDLQVKDFVDLEKVR